MEFFIILYSLIGIFNPALAEYYGIIAPDRLSYIFIGIAAAFFVCVYCFKAIALSAMAKKAGMQKIVWCAFIPFASTYLMGELAGDVRLGKSRLKKIGLFVMIAEILYTAAMALVCIPLLYALGDYQKYFTVVESDLGLSLGLSNEFPLGLYNIYRVGSVLVWIFELIFIAVSVFLYIFLFRKYAPASYIWLTILCVILPVSSFILFAFRNRKPVDFDALMRARAEAMRRQQQYYNNPYNNPYNNLYGGPYGNGPYGNNPYNNPYGQPQQPPREPDDPFGEYSGGSGQSGQGDPFGEYSGGGSGGTDGQKGSGSGSDGSDGGNNG